MATDAVSADTFALQAMFPDIEADVLQAVLVSFNGNVEAAVEVLLGVAAETAIAGEGNPEAAFGVAHHRDHAAGTGPVFASLEQRSGADDDWHYRASITADDQIHSLDVDQPARYRFVIQPRLFEAFAGTLQVRVGGQLGMPVVGAHAYDIGGGFGAARDGGARRHQGVDIFADAGTPVTAVVDGRVHQRSGGLGGKAIFLSAGLTRPRYYYAHLSAFTTADGARVKVGDVIGRVGATGNAAGGAPHLHFGIYSLGGAVDPAPYIRPRPDLSRPD